MKPMEIEKQSFAIIEKELTTQIPPQYKPIVKRVIHTTADFSYETNMVFSEGVVDKALEAIQKGTDIVTDTNMAGAGISHKMAERFGISLHCYMADEAVAKEAAAREITRAAVSVEKAAKPDRYSLNHTNVIDRTFLIKICQRNMSGCLININGSDWSRDFLDQSQSVF